MAGNVTKIANSKWQIVEEEANGARSGSSSEQLIPENELRFLLRETKTFNSALT